jgi:hypothetical protein
MPSPGAIAGIVIGTVGGTVLLLAMCLWALKVGIRRHRRENCTPNRSKGFWTYNEGVIWCEPELDPSFRVLGARCVGEDVELGMSKAPDMT